jgi:DNA-binding transcriptional MerR regulator
MLRLYSEEDIARLRLIKHLVGDLGLNVAGVQLVLQVFNNLLETRSALGAVDDDDLRGFTAQSLDRMFELLHAHTR